MNDKCDRCEKEIIEGLCECSLWIKKENMPHILKCLHEVLDFFSKSVKDGPISTFSNNGTAIVIFEGNIYDCKLVEDFITNNLKKET